MMFGWDFITLSIFSLTRSPQSDSDSSFHARLRITDRLQNTACSSSYARCTWTRFACIPLFVRNLAMEVPTIFNQKIPFIIIFAHHRIGDRANTNTILLLLPFKFTFYENVCRLLLYTQLKILKCMMQVDWSAIYAHHASRSYPMLMS